MSFFVSPVELAIFASDWRRSIADYSLGWWPGVGGRYSIGGVMAKETVASLVHTVPSKDLSVAACTRGGDMAAVHDLLQMGIGESCDDFLRPNLRLSKDEMLAAIVGGRYVSAEYTFTVERTGVGVVGRVLSRGSQEERRLRLIASESGFLSGTWSNAPQEHEESLDNFRLEVMTMDRHGRADYLSLNRMWLLRRSSEER